MTGRLARCTHRGCPWRWRTGDDRDCGQHTETLDPAVAAMLAAPPGGRSPRPVPAHTPARTTARPGGSPSLP